MNYCIIMIFDKILAFYLLMKSIIIMIKIIVRLHNVCQIIINTIIMSYRQTDRLL